MRRRAQPMLDMVKMKYAIVSAICASLGKCWVRPIRPARGSPSPRENPVSEIHRCPNPECAICQGEGWVCENHPNVAWLGGDGCCGGAGMPCGCNPDAQFPPGTDILCSVYSDGETIQ